VNECIHAYACEFREQHFKLLEQENQQLKSWIAELKASSSVILKDIHNQPLYALVPIRFLADSEA